MGTLVSVNKYMFCSTYGYFCIQNIIISSVTPTGVPYKHKHVISISAYISS